MGPNVLYNLCTVTLEISRYRSPSNGVTFLAVTLVTTMHAILLGILKSQQTAELSC
jgi:hypothetical protein